MSAVPKAITYQRKQDKGTLTLHGSVDIFEAALLHEAVQRASTDSKATTLCVDFAGVERLDISAVQLLLALRRDVEASGRLFVIHNAASIEAKTFAPLGVSLQP